MTSLTESWLSRKRFAGISRFRLTSFIHGYYSEQVVITLDQTMDQSFRAGCLDFQGLLPHCAVLILLFDDVSSDWRSTVADRFFPSQFNLVGSPIDRFRCSRRTWDS